MAHSLIWVHKDRIYRKTREISPTAVTAPIDRIESGTGGRGGHLHYGPDEVAAEGRLCRRAHSRPTRPRADAVLAMLRMHAHPVEGVPAQQAQRVHRRCCHICTTRRHMVVRKVSPFFLFFPKGLHVKTCTQEGWEGLLLSEEQCKLLVNGQAFPPCVKLPAVEPSALLQSFSTATLRTSSTVLIAIEISEGPTALVMVLSQVEVKT